MASLEKGVGARAGVSDAEGAAAGWSLLEEEVSLPAAVLLEEHLAHNLRWMQRFIDEYGLLLAPHGKTTMAPALFRRQLAGGAWGITVATAQQALVAFRHGVPRVLMANLLVGRRNLEVVAEALGGAEDAAASAAGGPADRAESPQGREFYCLVDSPQAVEHLGRFFRPRELALDVLLELGPAGGRTGARDRQQEDATLAALAEWSDAVRLAGVEIYEGVLDGEEAVRAFVRRAAETVERVLTEARVRRDRALVSGAGSAWYDVVAEELVPLRARLPVDVVLRPGCYLTHDAGLYRAPQERILAANPVARRMREGLRPALQIWAYVLSVPELDRAILGLGKRDVAFDAGYPMPAVRFRPGEDERPTEAPAHWKVFEMKDQHAYVRIAPGDDLRVGDMVGLDISHPCTTFDKWRRLVVVDGGYRVLEVVETFF